MGVGGDRRRKLGNESEETTEHEATKVHGKTAKDIGVEHDECEVIKGGERGEEVQGEDLRHGGKEGGRGNEEEERKMGVKIEKMKKLEAAEVPGEIAKDIEAEPAKGEVGKRGEKGEKAVSYTHLTLPTKRIV